jgi:magnesium-transporting ATPase (P-type)
VRSSSDEFIAVGLGFLTLLALAYVLYRPRIQQSKDYQATVVPLANIMDVGFILFSPAIVLLVGFRAPFFMLGICLVAIAAGLAIAYNIRNYEPVEGEGGRPDRLERISEWSLLGASMVNIAYYTMILMMLIQLPFDWDSVNGRTVMGIGLLAVLVVIGMSGGMDWLNQVGNRTTAFNLAAVIGIVIAFLVANVQEALGGRWDLGPSPDLGTEEIRKMIGLFAIVQGFEASRYIGVRFGAERRVSTMRVAQVVSTIVFVLFVVTLLLAFLPPPPGVEEDASAIFAVSALVGDMLPWLLLLAALGSQTSAIIGATSSRSDMLVHHKIPRATTFPIILVPAIMLVIFVDVNMAVNLASRVFAAFFTIQASLALILASRKKNWWAVAGFAGVALVMLTIMVFGLPL